MKSKAASFKVNVRKLRTTDLRKRSQRLTENISHNHFSQAGYHKHEGVNFYVSSKQIQLLPDPPEEIIAFIRRKIRSEGSAKIEQLLSKGSKNRVVREKKKKKKTISTINEFIAFRSYYSKFFNGIISQTELSSIISQHWASNEYTRKLWDVIAQKYNCEQTTLSFSEWMEYHYTSSKKWLNNLGNFAKNDTKEENQRVDRKPYIENVFITDIQKISKTENFTENFPSFEEFGESEFGLLESLYNFDEFYQVNYSENSSYMKQNTDLYSVLNPI